MLADLFAIIAPVFVCAGIGLVWARSGRPFDSDVVTALTTLVGTPCLVLSSLLGVGLELQVVGTVAATAFAALAAFAAVGWTVLRVLGLPARSFLPALIFPNTGNMGLPLCLLAFGENGLALAIGFFTVCAVGQFTVGTAIASGSASLRNLARNPIVYALGVALVFMLTGTRPPEWALNTVELLGGMTIPLMLITLGISLARLRVSSMKRSLGLSVLRLGLGFGVGLGLATLLGFEGAARGVVILQASMPTAVFNYLFAQHYRTAPEEVAGMVVISTSLSFLSLPLLLWYVL